MTYYDAATVKAAARGRWFDLLNHFGIDSDYLDNVHGPCPGCKGRDRFRFDNQNDDGTFLCSQGGGELLSGDGFNLLMHVKGWAFNRCLEEVAKQLEIKEEQLPTERAPPKKRAPKATFHRDRLQEFAARWRPYVDTAWLADRSRLMPYQLHPHGFLSALYSPGEKIVLFTNHKSQGQALWPGEAIPLQDENGVWFLAQPVDGEYHPNPRSLDKSGAVTQSRRSEEAVTSWRYLVIESDEARPRDWLAALVQLPLSIAAIYTSGKRSIHALVRVDATSKTEWDALAAKMKPILVTLGADPGSITAVRLTRLPGCKRGRSLQKLLYLNPEPTPRAICSLEKRRDTCGQLERLALPFLGGVGVIADAGAKNIDDCIGALDLAAKAKENGFAHARALRWFESAPRVHVLCEKVRDGGIRLQRSDEPLFAS